MPRDDSVTNGPSPANKGHQPIDKKNDGDNNVVEVNIKWKDRIDPKLRPILRRLPTATTTIDAKWKAKTLNLLMNIPGMASSGVKSKSIKGIGKYFYPKSEESTVSAAALYIHGGGRVMGCASGVVDSLFSSRLVRHLQVPVLSASYRLATEHPFPAALDDVVKAYKWLVEHMQKQSSKSDDLRIVVVGESAGGGLAAELCQRLLDESRRDPSNGILPVAQILVYPMLDDRTCQDEVKTRAKHLVWNNASNTFGWTCYLGRPANQPGDAPPYGAAARREDLSGLPPTWIMCGDLDLFLEECQKYAKRLESHGVTTRYLEVAGGFHGMMTVGAKEEPIVEIWKDLQTFGRRQLYDTSSSGSGKQEGI